MCALFGKTCRGASASLWHNVDVEGAMTSRLDALRPAIKTRWAVALRMAPAPSPAAVGLVTPAMLVFMLDDTLNRLSASLQKPAAGERRRRGLGALGTMSPGCRCGLNVLVKYYVAGAHALRATLPADLGAVRVEVLRHFNRIAHTEMIALCEPCRHRGTAICCLRPAS
jgi:hypothetical protein